jgi:hypothetical protein
MKKWQKALLSLGLAVVFVAAVGAQVTQQVDKTKLVVRPPVTARMLQPCPGPDLVAGRPAISKEIVGGKGFLSITGKVMNHGSKDFISNPRQAEAQLLVKKLWMSGPGAYVYLQQIPIARLNVNQEINLSGRFELPWFERWDCDSPPVPGYCCQQVQVVIMVSYDPDILMDANPDNDDCRYNNNQCPDVPYNHVWYTVECPW